MISLLSVITLSLCNIRVVLYGLVVGLTLTSFKQIKLFGILVLDKYNQLAIAAHASHLAGSLILFVDALDAVSDPSRVGELEARVLLDLVTATFEPRDSPHLSLHQFVRRRIWQNQIQ